MADKLVDVEISFKVVGEEELSFSLKYVKTSLKTAVLIETALIEALRTLNAYDKARLGIDT